MFLSRRGSRCHLYTSDFSGDNLASLSKNANDIFFTSSTYNFILCIRICIQFCHRLIHNNDTDIRLYEYKIKKMLTFLFMGHVEKYD